MGSAAALDLLFKAAANFGIPGIIVIIWYLSDRTTQRILRQYREDMVAQRRMYESNVALVKDYASVAADLKDLIVLNAQALQGLKDGIETNQFCPMVRLEKLAKGRQL